MCNFTANSKLVLGVCDSVCNGLEITDHQVNLQTEHSGQGLTSFTSYSAHTFLKVGVQYNCWMGVND